MHKHNARSGFTLIELSIVLVVISLIVSGIVAGRTLVRQAALRSVVSDFRQYESAIILFRGQYEVWPGDMTNATSYWSSVTNGNGDGWIDHSNGGASEHMYGWQHLSKGGYIKGEYTPAATAVGGYTNPNASNIGFFGLGALALLNRSTTNNLTLSNPNPAFSGATWSGSFANTKDSKAVDEKVDDGIANMGKFIAVNSDAGPAGCSSAFNDGAGGANYNLSSDLPACRIYYSLHK
jgi:prepilin-type N-terminal cleavage/methylation domain-containing protein